MAERFLTAYEVADIFQLHLDTVYDMAKRGKLPGAKIGNRWRFSETRLKHWFTEREASQEQPMGTILDE